MTATAASIGYGSTFATATTQAGTYTTLAEVTDLKPPSPSRDTHDATHYASTNGYKEFIAGLKDPGEAEVEMNYTDTGFTALRALFDSDAPEWCKITFPNGATLVFLGLCIGHDQTNPLNGVRKMTGKFKVSGAPTFTAAA